MSDLTGALLASAQLLPFHSNKDMDTEHLELICIIVGMQNGTATRENSSVLSYEIKYACAM